MNELRSHYEDALYTLLMEQVTQQESDTLRVRNVELLNDPDTAVPKERSDRCLNLIRKLVKQSRRPDKRKVLRIALTILAAVFALTVIAYAAIPEVRVGILNTIMVIRGEDAVNITYNSQHAPGEGKYFRLSLPEEFYETEHTVSSENTAELEEVTYLSANDDSNKLVVWLHFLGQSGGFSSSFDQEQRTIEETRELPRGKGSVTAIMVGNEKALFVEWFENERNAIVVINGWGFAPDQMWEIVESMEIYPIE